MVFVEIGNRKNREIDRFFQQVNPFMKKLSAYFRLIRLFNCAIIYPKQMEEAEDNFKLAIDRLCKYANNMPDEGYRVGSISASKINRISKDINDIWYWLSKIDSSRLQIDNRIISVNSERIQKDIREINPIYMTETLNTDLISEISGDFYGYIYQPIESDLFRHEAYMKQYAYQTLFVSICGLFVLVVLCAMLFITIPMLMLQILTVSAIIGLGLCLLILAVDMKLQIAYRHKLSNLYRAFKKKYEST